MATLETLQKVATEGIITGTPTTVTRNAILVNSSCIQSIFETKASAPCWKSTLHEDVHSIISNRDGSLIAALTSTSVSILNGNSGQILVMKNIGNAFGTSQFSLVLEIFKRYPFIFCINDLMCEFFAG